MVLAGLLIWLFTGVLIVLYEFGSYLGALISSAGLTPADISFMPWLIGITLVAGFLFVYFGATQRSSDSIVSSF
jgi:hypothetical protein